MKFETFHKLLMSSSIDDSFDASMAADKIMPQNKEQIDILLGTLGHEEWRNAMICLEILARANSCQENILENAKPYLLHDEPAIVTATVELFLAHDTFAQPLITDLVEAISVAKHKAQSSGSWKLALGKGLTALAKFPSSNEAVSESCMTFAKTFDFSFPKERNWKFDEYGILTKALGVIATHASADSSFAMSQLVCAMNSVVNVNITLAGVVGMVTLGLDKKEILSHVFEFIRTSVAAELHLDMDFECSVETAVDALVNSGLESATVLSFLIDPSAPWLDHNWEDTRPKGFNLMQKSAVFSQVLPSFEIAFAGDNTECARRVALFLGFAPSDKEKVVKLLISRIESTDPDLFIAILESILSLDTPHPEISVAVERASLICDGNQDIERLVRRLSKQFEISLQKTPQPPAESHAIKALQTMPEGLQIIDFMDDGSETWILYQKILEPRTPDQWETNADEFGVAKLEIDAGKITLTWAPLGLLFPKQPTGGDIARRVRLQWVLDQKATVMLIDPYMEDSWGDRHYLYQVDLQTLNWSRITNEHRHGIALEPSPHTKENPENRIGDGEIVCWPTKNTGVQWTDGATAHALENAHIMEDVEAAEEYARVNSPKSSRMHATYKTDGSLEFGSVDNRSLRLPPDLKDFDLFVRKTTGEKFDSMLCTAAFWAPSGELVLSIATRSFSQSHEQCRYHVFLVEL